MAWRVDEVDEVLEAVADVEERDGAALHGDATLLVKKFVDTTINTDALHEATYLSRSRMMLTKILTKIFLASVYSSHSDCLLQVLRPFSTNQNV